MGLFSFSIFAHLLKSVLHTSNHASTEEELPPPRAQGSELAIHYRPHCPCSGWSPRPCYLREVLARPYQGQQQDWKPRKQGQHQPSADQGCCLCSASFLQEIFEVPDEEVLEEEQPS